MTGTLLVTGGAGFIGTRVVAAAIRAGWRVRVLDSLRTDVHPASARMPDGIDGVRAEMTDPAAVAAALAGVDVVCHQAAKVGLGVDLSNAPDYVRSNDLEPPCWSRRWRKPESVAWCSPRRWSCTARDSTATRTD